MNKTFLRDEDGDLRIGRLIVLILVVVFCVVTLSQSVAIIGTNYTGVRSTFGQISSEPVSGFIWKIPYVQRIERVCNKQQRITIEGKFWGETKSPEQTPVYAAETTITYYIIPEQSAWVYANIVDYKHNILPTTDIIDGIKIAMRQLSADTVTDRGHIDPLSVQTLQEYMDAKYGRQAVKIVAVTIADMDFEDSYNAAIAEKSNAQKQYETQLILNEKNRATKEAEAEQKRIEAEGEAAAIKIAAEAEAEAIKTRAEAQAEANELLSKYLSDELIAYIYAKSWNGEMPEVVGSDGNIFSYSLNGDN